MVSYIVAATALGQIDRSEAAIQSVPPDPLTNTIRQGGSSVSPKDTSTEPDGRRASETQSLRAVFPKYTLAVPSL